jgi:hypothetical protein
MYAKKYRVKNEIVVAICDKELIGSVLREGGLVLDLKKHSSFYVGELVTQREASEFLKEATSMNLVGEKAVGLAIRKGLARKGAEKKIAGVPHLQVYQMEI